MEMEFGTGSLSACEKEGAVMVGVEGVRGVRRVWTRRRKEGASKVKDAPRRSCMYAGLGMAESWARV